MIRPCSFLRTVFRPVRSPVSPSPEAFDVYASQPRKNETHAKEADISRYSITEDHSKWDQILLERIAKYIPGRFLCVYHRSY